MIPFRKLPQKSYTLVHLQHAAEVVGIAPGTVLEWIMTLQEYSMHMLRTKDGLYVEVEGFTQMIRRRCKPRIISRWLRHVRPHQRSLSEAEKKYVASTQGFTCNVCKEMLTNTYEVDHIEMQAINRSTTHARINLQALCPKCHREKTWKDSIYGNATLEDIPLNVNEEDNIFARFMYKNPSRILQESIKGGN